MYSRARYPIFLDPTSRTLLEGEAIQDFVPVTARVGEYKEIPDRSTS